MSQQRLYRQLPENIKAILLMCEGWLVGSAPKSLLKGEEPTDYDIVVPSRDLFMVVIKAMTSTFPHEINSFGGFKFKLKNGIVIDIWCNDLHQYLLSANRVDIIYNLKRNILIGTYE